MKSKLPLGSICGRLGVTLMAAVFVSAGSVAHAETNLVRVGMQFGLVYLPLVVMEHDHLWEKQADARGVKLHVGYAASSRASDAHTDTLEG